jgi:hypothetical protein
MVCIVRSVRAQPGEHDAGLKSGAGRPATTFDLPEVEACLNARRAGNETVTNSARTHSHRRCNFRVGDNTGSTLDVPGSKVDVAPHFLSLTFSDTGSSSKLIPGRWRSIAISTPSISVPVGVSPKRSDMPEQTCAELLPVSLATIEPFRRRHSETLRKDSR